MLLISTFSLKHTQNLFVFFAVIQLLQFLEMGCRHLGSDPPQVLCQHFNGISIALILILQNMPALIKQYSLRATINQMRESGYIFIYTVFYCSIANYLKASSKSILFGFSFYALTVRQIFSYSECVRFTNCVLLFTILYLISLDSKYVPGLTTIYFKSINASDPIFKLTFLSVTPSQVESLDGLSTKFIVTFSSSLHNTFFNFIEIGTYKKGTFLKLCHISFWQFILKLIGKTEERYPCSFTITGMFNFDIQPIFCYLRQKNRMFRVSGTLLKLKNYSG